MLTYISCGHLFLLKYQKKSPWPRFQGSNECLVIWTVSIHPSLAEVNIKSLPIKSALKCHVSILPPTLPSSTTTSPISSGTFCIPMNEWRRQLLRSKNSSAQSMSFHLIGLHRPTTMTEEDKERVSLSGTRTRTSGWKVSCDDALPRSLLFVIHARDHDCRMLTAAGVSIDHQTLSVGEWELD